MIENSGSVTTTAAGAAGLGIEIAGLGQTAKFKRFADVLAHCFLDVVDFMLGIQEIADYRVGEHGIAILLEIGNFRFGQLHALMLLVMQEFALFIQGIKLGLGALVIQKLVNAGTDALELWLLKNGFAQFPGFLDDRAVFEVCFHIMCI